MAVEGAGYLGDIPEDAIIDFKWATFDGDGASVTRATDGTIKVYKANSADEVTAPTGITDSEDFDGLTGIHHCRIDTNANAFYAVGNDYDVVLTAATIDGQAVNAVIAHFSIENRSNATAAKLLAYIQLLARKDAAIATDNATELTAINADGGSGAGSFSNQTDSEQAIRDAIVDANPQNHSATANNETTGTLDSGTFADTATDNEVYYQTSPVTPAVGGFGLNVDLTFGIGTGRVSSAVIVNGKFTAGGQRTIQVWAYDYNLGAYVQLSNSGTDFGHSGSDSTQQYAMTTNMRQASDGEVKIRFTSTSTNTGDDWYCDYVSVSSVAQEAAGLTAEAIAQANWEHLADGHAEGTMGHVLERATVVQADVVSVTSASQFIIDDGVATNGAYDGMVAMVKDATDGHYEARRIIDWIGATKEIFLDRALSFTPDSSDHVHIIGPAYADVNVTHVGATAQTANDNGADINAILTDTALLDKWLKNKIVFSGTSMILYDDDNTTPLLTWTLSEGSTSVSGPYNRAKAT